MTKTEYIENAVSGIRNRRERLETADEIGCHIDELTAQWTERGFSPEEAEAKAVGEMGAPEKTAQELGMVHSAWRCVVATATSAYFSGVWLLIFAAYVIFPRWLIPIYWLFSITVPGRIVTELIFFCLGGLSVWIGGRGKRPVLCASVLLAVLAHLIFDAVMSVGEYGILPTSSAAFLLFAALSGNYDEYTAVAAGQISVSSAYVTALTAVLYGLLLVCGAVLTILAVRSRRRRSGKNSNRRRTVALRVAAGVCVLIAAVDLPAAAVDIRAENTGDRGSYDGWSLIQLEQPPEGAVFTDQYTEGFEEDTVRLEIDRDFLGTYFLNYVDGDRVEGLGRPVPVRFAAASADGLFDVYALTARCDVAFKKRWLLAIPEVDGRRMTGYAQVFDLASGEPILLPTGRSLGEKLWMVEINKS